MTRNTISLLPDSIKSAVALAGFLAMCLAVGGIGAALTAPGLEPWYAALEKPGFNPPGWVFGPVWTTLYVLMGYALWRVWSAALQPARSRAMLAFFIQLALNLAWSGAFFFMQSLGLGLIVIVCLLTAIIVTMRLFSRLDSLAAALFVPYVLWVGFATILNLSIFLLN